jgi:hypothetical protein
VSRKRIPTYRRSARATNRANLGSEDGALGGTSFNYNWTENACCFRVGVTNLNAPDLDCASLASFGEDPQSPAGSR